MDNNSQDWINAGSDILKSVTKAIDTNDYSKLASEITDTIKSVSIERKTTYASSNYRSQYQNVYRNGSRASQAGSVKNFRAFPFFAKHISRYDGLLEAILGTGAASFMAIFLLGSLMIGSAPATITIAALVAISGFFAARGFKKLKLSKAFYKYGNILKDSEYFNVSDLANAALEKDENVLKNLKAMIKANYLPRAKFDSSEKTCMITDAAYQLYMGAEQDRLAREQREVQERSVVSAGSENKSTDKVQSILADGREYISFVRQINDIIPDTEEMSNKLYKLESIMNKIFEQVKKNPDSAEDLHKLMNYYLPTIKKLLTAYVDLDKQAGYGENIQQTKKEIDAVMDTINDAFEKLLDSLFQDMAWDISSDISVMKTMMAQDGLTNDGMAVATAGGMAVQTQDGEQGISLEFGNK